MTFLHHMKTPIDRSDPAEAREPAMSHYGAEPRDFRAEDGDAAPETPTLYRAVHRSGQCSLPFRFMTEAALYAANQSTPSDWRTEAVTVEQLRAEPREPFIVSAPTPEDLAAYAERDRRGANFD